MSKMTVLERKWNDTSVRRKLLLVFIIPMILIIFTNVYMYLSINAIIVKVERIYDVNRNLNDLSEELGNVQSAMKEYLENKGTSSLNAYYIAEQNYADALSKMSNIWTNPEMGALLQNINNQSEYYFTLAAQTIQAKRGRIVEKYRSGYSEAEIVCKDIQTCIYSLNNESFEYNTDNYTKLLDLLRYMEFLTISVLFIVSVISIVVVVLTTRTMTYPLRDLSLAAQQVAEGDFNVNIAETEGNDEISVVSKTFKQMVTSIQLYINQIKESMHRENELKEHELVMENRMKEVQLKSLQAQINPHFLFNTLNAGSQLAMMEGADKTVEFIDNMAEFFRYNIKKINNDASIAEEIKMVDQYVYILNVRFTGEINYSKSIDESVLDVRVPSMIIQPIVENAINYGIRNIDWEGKVELTVERDETTIYISVKDNGIGMSKQKIDEIMSGKSVSQTGTDSAGSNGVGLLNVIERLQIFTGIKDVMQIFSEGENKGTEFVIRIPLSDNMGEV